MSEEPMTTRKRKVRRKPRNGHSNGHTVLEGPVDVDSSVEAQPEMRVDPALTEDSPEVPAVEASPETPVEAPEASPEVPAVEAPPETAVESAPVDLYPWPPPETPVVAQVESQIERPVETAMVETAPGERPFGLLARLEDPARNAIGWTPEHTRRMKAATEFYTLALQVDREVLHLCAGILALHLGDFEVVAINFQSCGIAVPQGRSG